MIANLYQWPLAWYSGKRNVSVCTWVKIKESERRNWQVGVLMLGQPRWTSLDGLRVSTTACQYMPQVRLQELAIYLMPR
jgi:hypothetical protein